MKPEDFPVFPSPFFAGLVTQRLHASWDFYTERLGFHTLAEGGTWVRLQHACGAQLMLVQAEAGDMPAPLVCPTNGCGWWLTLEVADAEAERTILEEAGVTIEALPFNGRWSPTAFAVRDPMGVLVVLTARPSLVKRSEMPSSAAA